MRLFRPGFLAGCLYPEALFRIKTTEKILYLTFDDGPDPVSTPQLLEILKDHRINAVFFCSGHNAEKHPELIDKILDAGHRIGNHTFNHLDGWRTKSDKYIDDVKKSSIFTSDQIFRPPFGHLKLNQYRVLKKDFQIIFWDVMPFDFDKRFGQERILSVLKSKIRNGSIIVLHDSASSKASLILEEFLNFAFSSGYRFELIPN